MALATYRFKKGSSMSRKQQKIAPPLPRNEVIGAWLQSRREQGGTGDAQRARFLELMREMHKRY
jgi:hypothetical protein